MARIAIDLDRTIGAIDRRIFGGFVEHLGRCIYGGIFEPGSPLSDEHGFRRDVLDAARQLRMPILRWPGGNFVSGYHWTDGVGPVEKRSKRLELAWRTVEPNTFGTHEFIEYCHALDLEPYICLNMGTGTLDEACAWVEYCNGVADTYWANLRRANGHPEPYNVRYWGLGNEMYGPWQIGHLTADEYVLTAQRWADALRRTDSTIELVGCGQDGWSDWDRIVVDGLARYVNYHSIHIYTGSDDYWSNVLAPHQAERGLEICQALINRARYLQNVNSEIGIAYDEWNVWFRERGEQSGLEERYTLADALAVATYLNIFVRHCRSVRIADLAQLVNVIAPIFTSKTGLFLQTIYHPLSLYAEHTQQVAVDPVVVCETVTHRDPPDAPWAHRVGDLGPFKLLDVAATRDETGRRLTLTVVNRSPDLAVSATVELNRPVEAGNARVHLVHGPSPNASNSFADPNSVGVRTQSLQIEGNRFELVFPQHSISCVELPVAVETTSAMRLVDPHIELVACGSSLRSMPTFPEWDATILELAYEQVDYLALHGYYHPNSRDPASYLACARDMDAFIHEAVATCDYVQARKRSRKRMYLSFDEFNVAYRDEQRAPGPPPWSPLPRMGEDVFTALDAVVFGSLLITLLRHADRVKIGCQSLLVNAVGPIMTEPGQSAWRQAIFHPMAQVAHWARGEVLRLEPVCATIETADHGQVPVLEAVATVDHAAPALTLFVMNRAQDEPVDLDCDVRAMALIGEPEHLVLDGRDPESRNTRENPDRVLPRRSDALQIHAGRLRVRLEPISWNVIRVPLRSPP